MMLSDFMSNSSVQRVRIWDPVAITMQSDLYSRFKNTANVSVRIGHSKKKPSNQYSIRQLKKVILFLNQISRLDQNRINQFRLQRIISWLMLLVCSILTICDGNCFYRAITRSLEQFEYYETNHMHVRQTLASFIDLVLDDATNPLHSKYTYILQTFLLDPREELITRVLTPNDSAGWGLMILHHQLLTFSKFALLFGMLCQRWITNTPLQ